MKQKRLKDKRQNTINMKNKRTASSATYKPIKPATRDYQNSNYDNQIDNKDNNRNIDMSIGLEEDKKKTKIMDQKGREAIVTKRSSHTIIAAISYIIILITADSIRII